MVRALVSDTVELFALGVFLLMVAIWAQAFSL